MKQRRVVLTGAGTLCSLGTSLPEFWGNALEGKTQVDKIPDRWLQFNRFRSQVWAPLPEINYIDRGIPKIDLLRTDPVTLNLSLTAHEALADAGLHPEESESSHHLTIPGIDPNRTGVYMGTAVGGVNSNFKNHSNVLLQETLPKIKELLSEEEQQLLGLENWTYPKKLNGFCVPMFMPNAISAYLAIRYSLTGPNHTSTLACAAGASAIGQAYRAIVNDYIDVALCGGSEYSGDEYGAGFKGFDAAGTLTTLNEEPEKANRPFDRDRKGFLFSEGGSATLVLEELSSALARGANIIAELSGFGESFDAHNMMRPAPDGKLAKKALSNAIVDAKLETNDIGYVNAHGTGTPTNDETEANMISSLLTHRPKVNATKSLIGHTIGASGALEAVITAKTLQEGRTHGCLNLDNPVVDLDYCYQTETISANHGITHSFAFGGHNIALVFSKYS